MRNSEAKINVNMSSDLRKKVEKASKKEGISKSAFIRSVLDKYFEEDVETQYSSMDINLDKEDKGWFRKLLKF